MPQTRHIPTKGEEQQQFYISSFLSDDVSRAPDLWLAVAATPSTSEALPHFRWAFATT